MLRLLNAQLTLIGLIILIVESSLVPSKCSMKSFSLTGQGVAKNDELNHILSRSSWTNCYLKIKQSSMYQHISDSVVMLQY